MSAPLILWCVIALFANVPTAFSRPRHIGKPVSEVKADEVQKRQSECGNVTNNELKSPRYPSYYPNYLHCVYWVVIPAGKTMNIYFNDFHLEYHSICSFDYLKIANEKDETFGGRNGKYCGVQYGNVSVTGQYAVLTFHSDSSFSRRGYNLTFTFAPVGSNGTQSPPTYPPIGTQGPQTVYPTNPPWYTTAPPNGTQGPQTVYPTNPPWYTTAPPNVGCGYVQGYQLTSPGYPNNYPNGIDCEYWVYIPYGKALRIYFNEFQVESHPSCSYDYLRIANEKNETFGGRNGKYCGVQNGSVSVTGQYAVLTFHSDGIVARRGYNLTFTLIPTGSNGTQPPPTYPPISRTPATMFPSVGPSPDAKRELQYLIAIVRYLLNQMEYVVNNEVFSVSVRDYEARVKRAITDVHHALRAEGRQKRDVSSVKMISQLEKKADDLIKQLQIKEDRYQRSAPKRKVAIEDAEKAY